METLQSNTGALVGKRVHGNLIQRTAVFEIASLGKHAAEDNAMLNTGAGRSLARALEFHKMCLIIAPLRPYARQ